LTTGSEYLVVDGVAVVDEVVGTLAGEVVVVSGSAGVIVVVARGATVEDEVVERVVDEVVDRVVDDVVERAAVEGEEVPQEGLDREL